MKTASVAVFFSSTAVSNQTIFGQRIAGFICTQTCTQRTLGTKFWVQTMGTLTDRQIKKSWIQHGERFDGRGVGDGHALRFRKNDATPNWLFR
jgi:hypothetical protein